MPNLSYLLTKLLRLSSHRVEILETSQHNILCDLALHFSLLSSIMSSSSTRCIRPSDNNFIFVPQMPPPFNLRAFAHVLYLELPFHTEFLSSFRSSLKCCFFLEAFLEP